MNTQSSLLVAVVLTIVLIWMLKMFVDKKISAGQTLFWLVFIIGAQILAIFPTLIDRLSMLWGNLIPISWITFVSIVLLVFYMIYLTIRLNGYSKVVDLARSVAYLEKRLRETESRCTELSERLEPSE